jgi:hypothetical protein
MLQNGAVRRFALLAAVNAGVQVIKFAEILPFRRD